MAATPGSITVRLPQALAEHADGAREVPVVEVEGPTSLGEVLDRLRPVPRRRSAAASGTRRAVRRFVNVYVGDDECRTLDGLRTTVRPSVLVYVIPSVAGG